MTKRTGSEEIIEDFLMGELRANGHVRHEDGVYVFEGANNDYLVEIRAMHMGKANRSVRLREPVIDFHPPYDR